jgi:hypothetical protein
MTTYTRTCTGDVVIGDTIEFTEAVFGGSYRKPTFLGERTVRAHVTKDSYGAGKQQHTFSMEVIDSDGYDALPTGKKIRRKGRNVYRNGTMRKPWVDESERLAACDEKHTRGGHARADRDLRHEFDVRA